MVEVEICKDYVGLYRGAENEHESCCLGFRAS